MIWLHSLLRPPFRRFFQGCSYPDLWEGSDLLERDLCSSGQHQWFDLLRTETPCVLQRHFRAIGWREYHDRGDSEPNISWIPTQMVFEGMSGCFYLEILHEAQLRKDDWPRAERIWNNWVYIQLDESVTNGRRIYLVFVERLEGKPSIPMLLDFHRMSDNVNDMKATWTLVETLKILWPDQVLYSNVRPSLTD